MDTPPLRSSGSSADRGGHMATATEFVHFHVWRVAATGSGAFMSRPYRVRSTAKKAATTWAGGNRRALTFVHQCELGADCPRPPRRKDPGARTRG